MASETRPVGGFDRIELRGIGKMVIAEAPIAGLVIEADPDVLPQIITEVTGTTLVISYRMSSALITPGFLKKVEFAVAVPRLAGVALMGAGLVTGGGLTCDDVTVTLSGSGAISLGLHATSVSATLAGAGRVSFAGRAQSFDARVSGAGECDAAALEAVRARVEIAGAGSATVKVLEALDATVSGVGTVRYYGTPHVEQRISGLGSVRPADA